MENKPLLFLFTVHLYYICFLSFYINCVVIVIIDCFVSVYMLLQSDWISICTVLHPAHGSHIQHIHRNTSHGEEEVALTSWYRNICAAPSAGTYRAHQGSGGKKPTNLPFHQYILSWNYLYPHTLCPLLLLSMYSNEVLQTYTVFKNILTVTWIKLSNSRHQQSIQTKMY